MKVNLEVLFFFGGGKISFFYAVQIQCNINNLLTCGSLIKFLMCHLQNLLQVHWAYGSFVSSTHCLKRDKGNQPGRLNVRSRSFMNFHESSLVLLAGLKIWQRNTYTQPPCCHRCQSCLWVPGQGETGAAVPSPWLSSVPGIMGFLTVGEAGACLHRDDGN